MTEPPTQSMSSDDVSAPRLVRLMAGTRVIGAMPRFGGGIHIVGAPSSKVLGVLDVWMYTTAGELLLMRGEDNGSGVVYKSSGFRLAQSDPLEPTLFIADDREGVRFMPHAHDSTPDRFNLTSAYIQLTFDGDNRRIQLDKSVPTSRTNIVVMQTLDDLTFVVSRSATDPIKRPGKFEEMADGDGEDASMTRIYIGVASAVAMFATLILLYYVRRGSGGSSRTKERKSPKSTPARRDGSQRDDRESTATAAQVALGGRTPLPRADRAQRA